MDRKVTRTWSEIDRTSTGEDMADLGSKNPIFELFFTIFRQYVTKIQ
jgi:hypothetical protein